MTKPVILIADDDERLLAALAVRLTGMGFEVVQATDGEVALVKAQEQPPDLLILDVNMPACDGFSLVEKMDHIPSLVGVPVIYITGADDAEELGTVSERLGAIGMIRKPFEAHELIESIKLVLPPPEAAVL